MSENTTEVKQVSPVKRLIALLVMIIVLIGALIFGSIKTSEARFTPALALDLEGGTQLILTPVATDGSDISQEDVSQAISIIRQRVDASGVAEAEITAQGGRNIVVSLPGEPKQETLNLVRTSAVLRLHPVLAVTDPNAVTASRIAQVKAIEAAKAAGKSEPDLSKVKPTELSAKELDAEILKMADSNGDGKLGDKPEKSPANASDTAWITEKVLFDAYKLQCGSEAARLQATAVDPEKASVACASTGDVKYILGPAEIKGTELKKASSSLAVDANGNPTGGWAVNMQFNGKGAKVFADVTGRIFQNPSPTNQFAIVLDGQVLSAPVPSGPIAGGNAQITGKFTAVEAATLANQLSFGSLPLNFEVQSEEQISATLGSEQLRAGLIAGFIGLILIVLYMLWQYHALGAISVVSIALSTGLSYLVICLLSWVMGYRLSMAGVLGMIISIGVTADSFIVYFERIRDEMRDERNVNGAIRFGWDRAKRTIIISDSVNLLASGTLYLLTVGSVRGFAFTLGVTTLLDLIVVMIFTHPLMMLLGRTKFFGKGLPFSGLDAKKLNSVPLYRGRGYTPKSKVTKTAENVEIEETGEVSKKESLAQRKARERREQKLLASQQENKGGQD